MNPATQFTYIHELADRDSPLVALASIDGELRKATCSTEDRQHLLALRNALLIRTEHLASPEAYANFYNTPAPERPYFPFARLNVCHEVMPRWSLVLDQLVFHQHQRLLEFGCFDGFTLLNAALVAHMSGIGIDVNAAAIAEATSRAERLQVPMQFMTMAVEDCDLPERFDAVLLLEILEHVRDVDRVLMVAERQVRFGGMIYISAPLTAPHHQHERERREHVRLFTYDAMMRTLHHPTRRLMWYTQLPTPDGMHHCGAYTVVGS